MPCRSGQVLLPREPVPAAEAAGDLAGAMAEARVGVMAAVVAMAEAMVVVTYVWEFALWHEEAINLDV